MGISTTTTATATATATATTTTPNVAKEGSTCRPMTTTQATQ